MTKKSFKDEFDEMIEKLREWGEENPPDDEDEEDEWWLYEEEGE